MIHHYTRRFQQVCRALFNYTNLPTCKLTCYVITYICAYLKKVKFFSIVFNLQHHRPELGVYGKTITWRDSSEKAIWSQEASSLQMGCSTRPSDLWTVTSQPPLTPLRCSMRQRCCLWGGQLVIVQGSKYHVRFSQGIGPDHVSRVKDDTSKENRLPLLSRD